MAKILIRVLDYLMMPTYQKLCTQFYDITKPEAGPKEVAFYYGILQRAHGPLLETMCGSGRLLIPLLKRGLAIDGLDNSAPMLESCRERCEKQHLSVKLHNQSILNLAPPQKYQVIFIAIGSFQLIKDRDEALGALKSLRQNLLPGGQLVIETFIPWESIKEGIHGSILSERSGPVVSERKVACPDGSEIILRSSVVTHFHEQLEISETHYEKWAQGVRVASEDEVYAVRWYYQNEMKLFLEKAGFSSVEIKEESFELNPQAVVYIAS